MLEAVELALVAGGDGLALAVAEVELFEDVGEGAGGCGLWFYFIHYD